MGKPSETNGTAVEVRQSGGSSSETPELEVNIETSSTQELTRSLSQMSSHNNRTYKVYKRRWLGLIQLILLNIVVSWSWITFAPISGTAARYLNITETSINWLSTAFMFAFVVATIPTFYVLAKHGPKTSIVISSVLLLVGNWIRYGGTRSSTYGVVMLGQLIIGLAQPFVLAAPTSYSNVWFTTAGRTSATAVASLANPLGAALGQLISPIWTTDESQVPNTVLYVAVIASVAAIPSLFLPARPPTPVSSTTANQDSRTDAASLRQDLGTLFSSVEFYLLAIPFATLVGTFNSFSSLLNQILEPYGFSEDEAGIAGALLIFVGLLSAAISSPLIDKFKCYLLYIRVATPIIGLCYLLTVWAPQTRSLAFICVLCAVNGAASFGLVPIALEYIVEIHYPLGPETGSTICWSGGQLLGGIFIVIMDQLKIQNVNGNGGRPDGDMYRSLVFQAVVALVVVPLPLCLGLFGRKDKIRSKRWESETRRNAGHVDYDENVEQEGSNNRGT